MGMVIDAIGEWLKEILVSGIIGNLSGLFDSVNGQVADISAQVGATPQAWNAAIYNMIRSLSENVIIPIAGVILAFVMTLELIQMVSDKNNMHGDVDTWMFFKWIFKTACAVLIVTNTWNIVMGVFDVGQSVVNSAAGVISSDASIDISSVVVDLEQRLMEMDIGPLIGLWFQSLFVGICTWALTICIFIITYGRMIEIYLVTSIAPIPMATMVNKDGGNMGRTICVPCLLWHSRRFSLSSAWRFMRLSSRTSPLIPMSAKLSGLVWDTRFFCVLPCSKQARWQNPFSRHIKNGGDTLWLMCLYPKT